MAFSTGAEANTLAVKTRSKPRSEIRLMRAENVVRIGSVSWKNLKSEPLKILIRPPEPDKPIFRESRDSRREKGAKPQRGRRGHRVDLFFDDRLLRLFQVVLQ